jgi:DNA-binding winged helix-turn-helix (wHTH) protein
MAQPDTGVKDAGEILGRLAAAHGFDRVAAGGAMGERYRIGQWYFDVAGAALRGDGGERRLEDRAARTLALLCRRRGEIVGQAEILREVWNGRAVSSNSVAVVIGDLRRQLGDDAREPEHIVTIPKRGYRLNAASAPQATRALVGVAAAIFALLLGLATLAFVRSAEPAAQGYDMLIVVSAVANDTGERRYAPLATALTELVVNRVSRQHDVFVSRGAVASPGRSRDLSLDSHLILWNGQPTLSFTATDSLGGRVVWSEMAAGPEDEIAAHAVRALDRFAGQVERLPPATNPYGIAPS